MCWGRGWISLTYGRRLYLAAGGSWASAIMENLISCTGTNFAITTSDNGRVPEVSAMFRGHAAVCRHCAILLPGPERRTKYTEIYYIVLLQLYTKKCYIVYLRHTRQRPGAPMFRGRIVSLWLGGLCWLSLLDVDLSEFIGFPLNKST